MLLRTNIIPYDMQYYDKISIWNLSVFVKVHTTYAIEICRTSSHIHHTIKNYIVSVGTI